MRVSFFQFRRDGFTLIELLVVLGIIIILVGLVINNYSRARKKSNDSKRITDLRTLNEALSGYFSQYGEYPKTNNWKSSCADPNWMDKLKPDFLSTSIMDPQGCRRCSYEYKSDGRDFKIINGCFQTDIYTAPGRSYDDPIRPSNYGAIYTKKAADW